jgi:hypothetical protein
MKSSQFYAIINTTEVLKTEAFYSFYQLNCLKLQITLYT